MDKIITDIEEAVEVLADDSYIGIDLETDGIRPYHDNVMVVSLYGGNSKETAVIHMQNYVFDDKLKNFLDYNSNTTFIGHNLIAFDLPFLWKIGVEVLDMNFIDTYICEKILNMKNPDIVPGHNGKKPYASKGGNDLQSALKRRLNIKIDKDSQGHNWTPMFLTEEQIKYCAEDVQFLPRLYAAQYAEMEKEGLMEVFGIEHAISRILLEMSTKGMWLDEDRFNQHFKNNKEYVRRISKELDSLAGRPINWGSPKQVKEVFQNLPYKSNDGSITTMGDIIVGTGKDHIQRALAVANVPESIDILVKFKELKDRDKLLMYSESWFAENTRAGHVHPIFTQMDTSTTRMSCRQPNFQQVPRGMRDIVAGGNEGEWMVSADFSQLEFRIHAALWQEQNMIDLFETGGDVHSSVGAAMYRVPIEDVDSEMRQVSKSCGFAVAFGAGAPTVMAHYNQFAKNKISLEETRKTLDRFFELYPAFKDASRWASNLANNYRDDTYMVSDKLIHGYCRLLVGNDIKMSNLLNTPTQMMGAIIIKKVLIAVSQTELMTHLSNAVHDEIVLTRYKTKEEAEEAGATLSNIMTKEFNAVFPDVRCEADYTVSQNWTK